MKKKFLSIIATGLCLCMSASYFVGCNQGGGGDKKPETEDEILAYVLEAAATSIAYNGAFTHTDTRQLESERPHYDLPMMMEEYQASVEVFSVDMATMTGYCNGTYTHAYKKDEQSTPTTRHYKVFEENGKKFSYEYLNDALNGLTETYEVVNEQKLQGNYYINNHVSNYTGMYLQQMKLPALTSVKAMNEAYASVFADSKAEVLEGKIESLKGITPDGSMVVSCEEKDGEYVLTKTTAYTYTNGPSRDSQYVELQMAAKDGKIVRLGYVSDSRTVTKEQEQEKVEQFVHIEETNTFVYGFDQAGYNAITTSVPADVAALTLPQSSKLAINVYVNGVNRGLKEVYVQTTGEALGRFTMKGTNTEWYFDEACTKKLDENTNLNDLRNAKAIYGKATPTKKAFLYTIEEKWQFAEDVSDAYKAVYAAMLGMKQQEKRIVVMMPAELGITWNGRNVVVTINGEVMPGDQNHYRTKAGETYEMKVVTTYTKTELNAFTSTYLR